MTNKKFHRTFSLFEQELVGEEGKQFGGYDVLTPLGCYTFSFDKDNVVRSALQLAQAQLQSFAHSPDFRTQMQFAFGSTINPTGLQEAWQNQNFSVIPDIQIRSGVELGGAIGAFASATKTIYLSQEFLSQNAANIDSVASVLLEEIGHAVDTQLNAVETPGDEGEIFSALVRGQTFEPYQLQQILAEDDTKIIILDGQATQIEQATVSDGGGFEGSRETLKLDSKGGGTAKYSYYMYNIPDQLILRYEGKNILDTGFVSDSKTGTVQIPKGNSDQLEVILATNDQDTLWDYTISTDPSPDTSPLVVEGVGGEFEDKDNDGDYEFNGTVFIGRQDGIAKMLRVEGATAEYDDKELRVTKGTVFSAIGGVAQPLFRGSFTIPFETGVTSSLEDDKQNLSSDFRLSGLDVNLKKLSLNQNGIGLGAAFKLPDEIGGISIDSFLDTVTIRQNGLSLGASGKLSLDPLKFSFFKLFDVEASNLSLEYDATEEKLKFQGKFAFDSFVKEIPVKKVTADLSEDNFVEIKDGKADFKGFLSVETDLKTAKGWGLSEIKLDIDTKQKDVGGSTKITFPFKGRIPETELGLGFKFPIPPLELNKVLVNVDNLNVPIPSYPLVFFQRFGGSIENFAPSDTDPIEFSGGLGATLGPQIDLPVLGRSALIRLDVDGKISSEQLSVTGKTIILNEKIATSQGTKTLDWNEKFYEEKGTYSILDGLIQTENSFKVETSFNINMSGKASANVPNFIPKIGGKNIANGEFAFSFSNDGNFSNDSAAVWTKFEQSFFGVNVDGYLGFRGYFDGRRELIASSLPPVNSFIIAPNTKWIALTADWTNPSNDAKIRIKKPDGSFVEEADFAANNIAIFDEFTNSDTRTAVVVNPDPGVWDIEVVDDLGLGTVEYSATRDSVTPTIQVTAPATDVIGGSNVIINYNAFDADSDAKVSLFYDVDNQGFDGILFKDGLTETDSAGNFVWNTQGVPTGEYFIYAMIMDENNPPAFSYSQGKVKVTEAADLSVTTTTPVTQVGVGSPLTYTVTLTNNGTSNAQEVSLSQTLASGETFVSASVNPTQQSSNTLTFNLGDLANNATKTVDITVNAPTQTGVFTSSVLISSNTFDSDATNDVDYTTTNAVVLPPVPVDLSVTRTDSSNSVKLGENYTYTLTVVNNGQSDATGVVLNENLPSGVNFVSANSSQGRVSNSFSEVITANLGNLSKGASATVTFTVNSTVAGRLVSTTSVTSNETDSNTLNNEAIFSKTIDAVTPGAADLELSQTVNNVSPNVGDLVNFTLTLTNKGPGTASSIKVLDLLPAGLTFESAVADQGTYNSTTGVWDVGNIRDNLSRKLNITATVTSTNAIINTAEITAVSEKDPDSVPGNNNRTEDDQATVILNQANATPKLAKSADDIFTISGGKPKLSVTLTGNSSSLVNELGVFTVDDEQGTINGIAPNAAGYAQAALDRAKVIFSAITNVPEGFVTEPARLLEFQDGDRLRFFLVKNSTIDAVQSDNTSVTDVLFSNTSTQKVTDLSDGGFSLAWEDGQGTSVADFQDMVVKIQGTNQPLPLGASVQGNPQGELIDLRALTTQVRAEFVLNREAAFDNCVGFYKVADVNGGIDTDEDGMVDLRPGDAGYAIAAMGERIAGIDLTVNNQGTATFNGTLQPGAIFAPFIIANGTPNTILEGDASNDPAIYFPFLGANPGKVDHIRLLGNNTFGFEDLPNGGDMDYNDVIVRVNLTIA